MSKEIKSYRNYKVITVIFVLLFVVVSGLFMIPVETVRVGECGGAKPIRLSFVNGDVKKLEDAKKEAQDRRERKEEALKRNPGIAMGCSLGPTYQLYVI